MRQYKLQLDILTEEQSAEAALRQLVPQLLDVSQVKVTYIYHQGKPDLLRKLPQKLTAYGKMRNPQQKVLVLLDCDKDECEVLKREMEKIAATAGALTKTAASGSSNFWVVNRIAIEELEAWFLGDEVAVCTAYPKLRAFPTELRRRNPDKIKDPFETLVRALKKAGYQSVGGKIELSRKIAAQMNDLARNRSTSFQTFCEGIRACL